MTEGLNVKMHIPPHINNTGGAKHGWVVSGSNNIPLFLNLQVGPWRSEIMAVRNKVADRENGGGN